MGPSDSSIVELPLEPVRWGRTAARAVVVGLAVLGWALFACWPMRLAEGPTFLAVNVAVAVAYVLSGVVLLDEDGHRTTGLVLVAAGVLWPTVWVNEWGFGPWPLVAALAGPLPLLLALWAILRYPRHWRRRREVAATAVFGLYQVVSMLVVLTSRPEWHTLPPTTTWLQIWPDWTAYRVLTWLTDVGGAVLAFAAALALTVRARRLIGLDRAVMRPVVGAIWFAAILTAIASVALLYTNASDAQNPLYLVQETALLVVPAAYLTATVRRRTAGAALPDLLARLEAAADPAALQDVLRRHLGDPGLVVGYRGEGGEHVDAAGERVDVDGHPGVRTPAGPTAVILSHSGTARYPLLMAAVARALAIVLANDSLSVLVAVRIAAVARSADRIREVIDTERGRFAAEVEARVLTRLERLRATIDAIAGDPDSDEALAALRAQLADAHGAVVALVRGRFDGAVRRLGLAAALRAAAAGLGGPIRVRATELALPPELATDLLMMGSELMVNAVKHAGQATVNVYLRREGSAIILEVLDDGVGGADPTGSGLRGIARRAADRGGELAVHSPRGTGTMVVVRLPELQG